MKRMLALFSVLIACGLSDALAMDGTFDRSTEIAKYLEIAKSGTRVAMFQASKDIYTSGISDPVLAAAISERLLKEYLDLKNTGGYGGGDWSQRNDVQYGRWMVKAIGSFGLEESKATLQQIEKKTNTASMRVECSDELELIEWHRRKNEIMASRKYHVEGADQRASQLLNLVMADDFTFKRQAADRIVWEKINDARVNDAVNDQVLKYKDSSDPSASRPQEKTMGLYVKILGLSGQAKYRDTLEQVMNSKAAMQIKKHTKDALERLQ